MKKGQSKVIYSKRLNNEKGQASMEFLMVYGWAILAAVVAIGVLAYYGVFTPGKSLPSLCFVEAPLGCSEFEVAVDGVRLFLINGAGTAINVTNVSLPGTPACGSNSTLADLIPDGGKFEVIVSCPGLGNSGEKFDGKIEIRYILAGKQIEQKASGDIKTDIRSFLSGGPVLPIPPVCGDGNTNVGEQCDDGDTSSGDGCSAICTVESGYTCSGEPSSCYYCGNNLVEGSEFCDSGNLNGQTCVTQGYDGGSLSCAGNCLSYNYGSCTSTCGNGQTQPCSNQVGVCSGSFETCAGNSWSVCGVSEYGVGYEATESSCSDALDNDCDGDTDGSDSNCPSDLLVHLTFDGNMLDSSGNANYGSCVGSACPLLTTDKDSNPNTAYSFDGSNDYINVNSAIDNLQSLSEGTIVLWVNINVNTGNINSF